MDSTKKITKKLTGPAKGTAQWLTSVGNESGQVLISVLTANEGAGLDLMAAGLVNRYQRAGVDPPVVLYVDCGCCKEVGETKLKSRFGGWPDIIVRLDIWHFMRRLATGCTTDAHQLYPTFMSRISSCIFEWDAGDVGLLRKAKREQLAQQGWPPLTEKELDRHLTKEELALHCRRKTRGEETTIRLLSQLIGELMSKGNDALGVPLLDSVRMQHIWDVQRRHVACIQDPPNVALYTETGSITKGGVVLKTYRCARGSTSLESFHCHLNRFIPGNSANSLNFQVYLLEGLNRWNQDRAAAAVVKEPSPLRTYTGELVHFVNDSFLKVFGKKLVTAFTPPGQYTGELIGVQYLLRQNSEPLQDMCSTSETMSELLGDLDVQDLEDEGFAESANDDGIILADLMISDVASLSEPPEALFQCLPVPSLQPELQPVPSLQPAHQPVPSFQPAPPSLQPTPQPLPLLQPVPSLQPALQPVPSLQPAPQPLPLLQPVPSFQPAPPSLQPTPQSVPSRHPAPQPVPSLQPVPSFQPAPQPVPSFQPVPSLQPAPQPVPSFQPAPPSLQPTPQPVPSLQPAHQPVPSFQPAPPSLQPTPQPVSSLQPVPSLQPTPQPVPSFQPAPPSLQPAPPPPASSSQVAGHQMVNISFFYLKFNVYSKLYTMFLFCIII
ncbi:arginine-glutamic acid dipeptide repeats protein-like [Astyanax mexicanus]|uniref:Arginine-glutamic acid dipeptide repeats protein-like n=1 Tax=Astyanax mexicanus TaxID=7994 RepID=A0A8T2LPK3_ASTMX|nr:arginine-glutamic acid dipeptide repeats protein-like [Astyanax mexicanus]